MARVDHASRFVPSAPVAVYSALVDPAALSQWLAPDGMTARFAHFDPRPGGSYRLVLTYSDAANSPGKTSDDSDVVDATFVELEPGSRVVQHIRFESDDPAFAGTMTMTWTLTAADGGTTVDVRATDVPPGISPDDHAAGMASSLEHLAAYLAA